MTRINIEIPDELHKKLKVEAIKEDIALKDFIVSVLRHGKQGVKK